MSRSAVPAGNGVIRRIASPDGETLGYAEQDGRIARPDGSSAGDAGDSRDASTGYDSARAEVREGGPIVPLGNDPRKDVPNQVGPSRCA
jgi:hypothetical protein